MANQSTEPTTPLGKYRILRGWTQKEVGDRIKLERPRGERETAGRSYVSMIEADARGKRLAYRSMREEVAAAYDLPLDVFDLLRARKRSAKWAAARALGNHGATDGGTQRNAPQAERAVRG